MAGPGFLHRFGPLPTHQAGPHSPSSPLPPLSFSPTSSTPQSSGSLALTSSSPQTVFLTSAPSASLSSSSSAPSLSSSPSSVSASSLSAAPSSSLSSSPLPMFSSTSTSSLSGLAGVRGEGQSSGPSDHGASHFFGMLASAKASAASPGREPIREKKRVQVKHACVNCQVAKTACSSFRPCQYCIDRQIESTCTVAVRKPRRPAKIPRLAVPGTNQFCQMPMTFSKPPLSPHNKQGMLPPASSTSASASNPSISSLSISSLAAASSAVTSDPLDSASASWQQRMFTFGQPTMLGADVAKTTNAASSSSTAARLPASGFATASRFAGDSSTSTSSSSTAPGPSMEQRRWRKRSTSSGGDFLVDFSKSLTHLAENSERASTGTFEPTASMSDSSLSALDSYASAHMLSPRGSSAPGASGFLGSPYHNFSSPNATPSALLPSFSPSSGYLPPLAELFSTKIRSEDSSLGSTSSSSLSSPSPSLSSLASSPMSSMLSASSSSLSTHASSPSLATAASTALNAATPTQPHTHHRLQQSQQQQRADTPPQPEEQKNDVEWFFYTTHADHPVSISMWNLTSGDILQSNQEFLNLVGRTYEELVLGFSLRHLFSPEAFVEIQMAIKAPQITSIPLPIDLSSFPLTISSKASEHISSFLYKITMPEEWQRDDPNVARVIGILMQFPLGKTAKHKDQTA